MFPRFLNDDYAARFQDRFHDHDCALSPATDQPIGIIHDVERSLMIGQLAGGRGKGNTGTKRRSGQKRLDRRRHAVGGQSLMMISNET